MLDLTNNEPENNVPPKWKLWLPIGIGALLIIVAAVFYFGKSSDDGKAKEYSEDELPAIKVVVTNGCGYVQLASEYAAAIAGKNIEVVSLADTPKPIYDKSIIVVRKGDMQDLKRLQKMTGIQRWTSALNEYYIADFEIIVGKDYEEFISD
jgi:hypothetical protein